MRNVLWEHQAVDTVGPGLTLNWKAGVTAPRAEIQPGMKSLQLSSAVCYSASATAAGCVPHLESWGDM